MNQYVIKGTVWREAKLLGGGRVCRCVVEVPGDKYPDRLEVVAFGDAASTLGSIGQRGAPIKVKGHITSRKVRCKVVESGEWLEVYGLELVADQVAPNGAAPAYRTEPIGSGPPQEQIVRGGVPNTHNDDDVPF